MTDSKTVDLAFVVAKAHETQRADDVDLMLVNLEMIADEAARDHPAIVNAIKRGLARTAENVGALAQRMIEAKRSLK